MHSYCPDIPSGFTSARQRLLRSATKLSKWRSSGQTRGHRKGQYKFTENDDKYAAATTTTATQLSSAAASKPTAVGSVSTATSTAAVTAAILCATPDRLQ